MIDATSASATDSAAPLDLLARIGAGETLPCGMHTPRVMNLSLYCFKSFAVRGFHALSRRCGVDVDSVFFKDTLTNRARPVSAAETAHLLSLIRDRRPDLITMSVMAPYVVAARELVAAIRKITDTPIVLGGKFPTISPAEALEFADFACKGEGELVLIEAYERMKRGEDLKGIAGLWYKDDAGQPVDMGQQRLIENIDDLPFQSVGETDMHFIEYDTITRDDPEVLNDEIWVMAGRGCVYLCSYCVNSLLIPMNRGNGRFVRLRSPDSIIDEILALKARQPQAAAVSFNDEVFGVFDDWTAEFSQKYKERVGLPFHCELVPKLIKEHNVRHLVDAGMNKMHFGIQSGSDEIRAEVMRRPGKNTELLSKARMLVDLGVHPQFDMILDSPFDTPAVLEESIDLLLAMPYPMNLNTYKMQYFPHYPLTNRALEEGHITQADVSYEKVADTIMNSWIFVPRISLKRYDHLQAAIYLMPWNFRFIKYLTNAIRHHPSAVVGLTLCVLARARYEQDFIANPLTNWPRRLLIAFGMIANGRFSELAQTAWHRVGGTRLFSAGFRDL